MTSSSKIAPSVQSGADVAMEVVSTVAEAVVGVTVVCEIGNLVGGRVEVTKGSMVGVAASSEMLMQAVKSIHRIINVNFLCIG